MSPSAERQLAHARILRARGNTLPPDGLPPSDILDSWVRSMNSGLDFAAPLPAVVVEGPDLAHRRERSAVVRRLAQAELETLAQQIAGSNFLLAFADFEGVILDLYADNRFAMSGSDAGIVAGSSWSETLCGTNGLGTALASGRSVAVSGLEHYFLRLGEVSCIATPVRDTRGDIVGVLDASSYFDSRQRHTQALVQMAATNIENGLLLHQTREHLVLAIHPRPEFLGTLSAGLLAFDDRGRLVAVNVRGRQLLQGLEVAPGAAFEELFGEPYAQVLARLHRGGELRLRDVLGSSLVVRCVGRPQPRPTAIAAASRAGAPRIAATRAPSAAPVFASADPAVVAEDPALLDAFHLVEAAVRMSAPILIVGETGTGKEVLARHAHRVSGRPGAFVAVNCGALPDELFEAELFGYVGGAFTGARREGSAGLIVGADRGTLLLDEVRELPLPLQAALLRFLDDGLVRPVGGTAARQVDVQLLAATNADLDDEVAMRRFRADLLYRLNTVRVQLPPLRLRRDFALAVRQVLQILDPGASIDAPAVQRLGRHLWQGNFRELRSVLTRALLGSRTRRLEESDVERLLPAPAAGVTSSLQQAAAETIRREYERSGRSVSQTARRLGVSRTTIYRHLGDRR